MYKRRDWLLLHGPDGGDSSSEEDSESGEDEEERAVGGSSDGEKSDNGSDEEVGEDGVDIAEAGGLFADGAPRHLEDISEDDYEDGDSEDEGGAGDAAVVAEQLQEWLDDSAADKRGRPLRCITCPALPLLLNARDLQSHVASKRHRKLAESAQLSAETAQNFCFAEAVRPNDEAAETHAERHRRIAGAAGGKGAEAGERSRKRKGKKLGKRHRLCQTCTKSRNKRGALFAVEEEEGKDSEVRRMQRNVRHNMERLNSSFLI